MTTDTHVVTLIGGAADGRRVQVQGWPRELEVTVAPALSGSTAKYHRRPVTCLPLIHFIHLRHFIYIAEGVPFSEALRKLLQGYRA